jgi:hypothetical protein
VKGTRNGGQKNEVVEVMRRGMVIQEVNGDITLDKVDWRKRIHVVN